MEQTKFPYQFLTTPPLPAVALAPAGTHQMPSDRSEEHTSELQSLTNLVCRLLLETKKLIAALPNARVIFAPSPGLSPPSILSQWIVSVFARPASCAAPRALPPLIAMTNRIPLPGC